MPYDGMPMHVEFEPGSYRDRDARVFRTPNGSICRALSDHAWKEWEALRLQPFFLRAMADGRIVRSESCNEIAPQIDHSGGGWSGTLRHESIPFVSYPFEWSFGMLRDAGLLQLELLDEALAEGTTLKDGTAYNVQWVGSRPVFIDVPSFVRHDSRRPWAGYRQFCQTCLFPLLVQAYRQVSFQPWLRGCLEGISPHDCANILGWRHLLRPDIFTHVGLHAWLERRAGASDRDVAEHLPANGFDAPMLRRYVAKLANRLRRLRWTPRESAWSEYSEKNTYSSAALERKRQFIRTAVHSRRWRLVWDLGANAGTFASIAAENADTVIALDADHAVVERLYQSLKNKGQTGRHATVLPLVINLADSSPGLGWQGKERLPLIGRAQPDLVLCLALLHHLVLGAGIPLGEVLEWLAGLRAHLVIEFVDRSDAMVQRLLRGRRDNYADYQKDVFERYLFEQFDLIAREQLEGGTRELYFVRLKV